MARNEEKAQSMLNRWLEYTKDVNQPGRNAKRPTMTSKVDNVQECEKWRGQILKEVARKVQEIQDVALGEKRTRELNDDINRLMREKEKWERRLLDLGGPNYFAVANRLREEEDGVRTLGGGKGEYKYFGEARKLPEVRELFKQQEQTRSGGRTLGERRAADMYRGLDADYYGFRDDQDTELARHERVVERKARASALKEWKHTRDQARQLAAMAAAAAAERGSKRKQPSDGDDAEDDESSSEEDVDDEEDEEEEEEEGVGKAVKKQRTKGRKSSRTTTKASSSSSSAAAAPLASLALPSREEIERALLEKRKEELMRKYVSPALLASMVQTEKDIQQALQH